MLWLVYFNNSLSELKLVMFFCVEGMTPCGNGVTIIGTSVSVTSELPNQISGTTKKYLTPVE